MCFWYEGGEKDGKGFRRCPRSRLQEITNTAKKDHNIDFLVGVEIEFCIFDASKGTPEPLPVAPNTWSAASLNNKYTPIRSESTSGNSTQRVVQAFMRSASNPLPHYKQRIHWSTARKQSRTSLDNTGCVQHCTPSRLRSYRASDFIITCPYRGKTRKIHFWRAC